MNKFTNQEPATILGTLCLLTSFFILAQIAFFLNNFHPYLKTVFNSETNFHIPSIVVPEIVLFLVSHLILYILLVLFLWFIVRGTLLSLPHLRSKTCQTTITLTLIVFTSLLWANQYLFPSSQFSLLLAPLLNPSFVQVIFYFLMTLLGITMAFALWGWYQTKPWITLSALGCVCILIGLGALYTPLHKAIFNQSSSKPNIILVGIDSVRPDHLSFFGSPWTNTPHLDTFLKRSHTFRHAFTPYGRTYPSWVSILTGLYPPHHGARYNLINPKKITALDKTLSNVLKQQGYQSLFATDENRFSNIDQQFHFDKIVGPKMGFSDFLLGSANDFPLSNLIINTRLGQLLFPHTYANRAAAATYNPKTFLSFVNRSLDQLHSNQPTFIAVHLCLPHWPYLWQQSPNSKPKDATTIRHLYRAAINRVDSQFYQLIKILKVRHLLDHSWLVVLSDHAEGLALTNDLLIAKDNYRPGPHSTPNLTKRLDHSAKLHYDLQLAMGHGTNVLSLVQFEPLLAFHAYGIPSAAPKVFNNPVSLLDIKSTIADLLDIKVQQKDGISLKSSLLTGQEPLAKRDFYFESALLVDAIRAVHPNLVNVIKQGLNFYTIDQHTGYLIIRDSKEAYINKSKQYAVYRAPWFYANYPVGPNKALTILVNTNDHSWTDDLGIPWAQRAPIKDMQKRLNTLFNYAS